MAAPTVRRYLKENGNEVKHVYRHLPLSIHDQAIAAAEAVEAAGEQGKFWEMEERIFIDQTQLSPVSLKKAATEIGLDMKRFNAALEDHRFLPRVQADVKEAQRLGIASTPTFVINGVIYSGAPSYEELDAAVKEARKRAQ